jgi:hypothetical protein
VDYAGRFHILAEQTLTGTKLHLYGRECLVQNTDDECLYYLTDGTGYVRQTTDEQGQLAGTWLFYLDGAVPAGPEGPGSHLVCGGVD